MAFSLERLGSWSRKQQGAMAPWRCRGSQTAARFSGAGELLVHGLVDDGFDNLKLTSKQV
jgi:hypothetical protein